MARWAPEVYILHKLTSRQATDSLALHYDLLSLVEPTKFVGCTTELAAIHAIRQPNKAR